MESEQVRSIVLAALMVGSVMVGIFYFDIESVQPDQPPIISGEEPGSFVIGDVSTITITIDDEKLEDILLDVTLDGDRVANSFLDEDGKLIVDISQLGAGEHALKVFAKDILDQETRWFTEFSITYPEEGITEIVLDTLITNKFSFKFNGIITLRKRFIDKPVNIINFNLQDHRFYPF